jgi:hypothetical protein
VHVTFGLDEYAVSQIKSQHLHESEKIHLIDGSIMATLREETNSVEQSSSEANSRSASQEIPGIL